MFQHDRRRFLCSVGQGMFVASVGYGVASDLGLSNLLAGEVDVDDRLTFGQLEPLVSLLEETPPEKLLPKVVKRLHSGTSLKSLAAAAALANARAFGGEDYVGFHTLMALGPAYSMRRELPKDRQALALLKVLYRNTNRIQEHGGVEAEVLRAVRPGDGSETVSVDALQEAVRRQNKRDAEQILATMTAQSPEAAYNQLFEVVEDSIDVHRVVLAHRVWDMLDLVGREHALSMFRQSLRYCIRGEERKRPEYGRASELLPSLLEEYKLLERSAGSRQADDAWIDRLSQTIFTGTPEVAATAAAAALAEGFDKEDVAEAIALAANQLVLRDSGRQERDVREGKPLGSVHGDSIGVHACDSAHAWRGIARVADRRNSTAAILLSAYQVAFDRTNRGGEFLDWQPRPYQEDLEKLDAVEPQALLERLESAIRSNNQSAACAAVHCYGMQGHEPQGVFDVLLRYAVSEDGALHAEKYYRTASDEFRSSRPAFRWRQAVALARVTASEYGQRAPGYEEACGLLGVEA